MNVRNWLMHLYPRWWRERYEGEFEALLEECLDSPLDVLDIFLGALDAHLELTHEKNWRLMNMNNKLGTAILLVFASYIAFIVAGFGLTGLADDSQLIPLMKSNPSLSVLWTTIEAGSAIGLLAIVIGGAPLAWTIIQRAFTSKRKDFRLLPIPLYSLLALILYSLGMVYMAFNTDILDQPISTTGNLMIWGLITVFLLGAIASTIAVWKLISQTDVEQGIFPLFGKQKPIKLYEFAFGPAVIAALAMLVMFLATVLWGWQSYSLRPDLFTGNMGVMMTSTRSSFAFTLLLMAAASLTACYAVLRGKSSRNMR